MAILQNSLIPAAAAEDGYTVEYSCRFNDGDSPELSRTYTSSATWTFSCWVKRGELGATNNIFGTVIGFNSSDQLFAPGVTNTSAVYRDPSGWFHICVSDSGLFVNGAADSGTVSTSAASSLKIGDDFDGYLADVHFIDGTAKQASDFAETDSNGQWVPKEYTGSYGTTGFHLDFSNSGALGADAAGSNDFTASDVTQLTDSPSAGRNHATWNPLTNDIGTLTEGNLKADGTDNRSYQGTIGLKSGKWQWEVYVVADSTGYTPYMGVTDTADDTDRGGSYQDAGRSFIGNSARKDNTATTTSEETPAGGSGIFGFALDLDSSTKTLKFYKDGSLEHTDETISADVEYFPLLFGTNSGSNSWRVTVLNCGQDPTFVGSVTTSETEFAYPISGYNAIKAANLPDPGVNNAVDSEQAFEVITYEGTETEHTIPHSGTSPASMSFNPDLIWVKNRSNATGYHHGIADTVRGISSSSTPLLSSSSDGAEYDTTAQIEGVSSNQITLGDNSDSANYVNLDDDDYVAWAWKAGTGFSSTNGSDTTSGSKNADAGFSIVKWEGEGWDYYNGEYPEGETQSIYHGLGATPELIIAKSLSNNAHSYWSDMHSASNDGGWVVWTKDLYSNTHLQLHDTGYGIYTGSSYPDPIQSVGATTFGASNASDDNNYVGYFLNFGDEANGNYSSDSYVAYCFRSIAGHSRVGKYTGNGLSDGPMIPLDFSPKFIWVKSIDSTGGWSMLDSGRNPYNVVDINLSADSTAADYQNSTYSLYTDFCSNGFKIRNTQGGMNSSGTTYIYYAVGDPFKHANAR